MPLGPRLWRFGWLAAGFLAGFLGLGLTTGKLPFILGLRFLETDLRPCFDLRFCYVHRLEPFLATGNFIGQVHAVRHRRLVGLLGHRQQRFDFVLELDFQLFDMTLRQGTVLRCMGVDLRAVQADCAQLE